MSELAPEIDALQVEQEVSFLRDPCYLSGFSVRSLGEVMDADHYEIHRQATARRERRRRSISKSLHAVLVSEP